MFSSFKSVWATPVLCRYAMGVDDLQHDLGRARERHTAAGPHRLAARGKIGS